MGAEQILLVAAIVIIIIVRRFAGSPVGSKSVVLPFVLVGYGLVQLAGSDHHHAIGAANIGLLIIEALVSIVAGVARAATIKLYLNGAYVWQRYTVATLLVWIAMIAVRFSFMAAGHYLGATLPEGGTVMFAFGLSMVFETLFVARRAAAAGAPIMPRQPRRSSVRARY